MGPLNSYPNTNLHVLTPPSPTMARPTRKRKAGDSKRSKRAVTRKASSGSNSSSREPLQYADLVSQVLEIAATPHTAEITILELMRKYSFSLATLKDLLRSVYYLSELRIWLTSIWLITALENKLDVSFSNVKYRDIAPMVGLEPGKDGDDMVTFGMARARLPDEVFQKILLELEAFAFQYGSINEQGNEEARSRYLSAVISFIFLVIKVRTSLLIVMPPSILTSLWLFFLGSSTTLRKPS